MSVTLAFIWHWAFGLVERKEGKRHKHVGRRGSPLRGCAWTKKITTETDPEKKTEYESENPTKRTDPSDGLKRSTYTPPRIDPPEMPEDEELLEPKATARDDVSARGVNEQTNALPVRTGTDGRVVSPSPRLTLRPSVWISSLRTFYPLLGLDSGLRVFVSALLLVFAAASRFRPCGFRYQIPRGSGQLCQQESSCERARSVMGRMSGRVGLTSEQF